MKNTTIKDIVSRTMEKIYKHLTDFKMDAYTHNIDNCIIDSQIKLAGQKYGEFKRSKKVQDKVNTCIKDIYCKNRQIHMIVSIKWKKTDIKNEDLIVKYKYF